MSQEPLRIACIGLGAMGRGMAQSLLRAGFDVVGCDPMPQARKAFADGGGATAPTAQQAARGRNCLVSIVVNAAQTRDILFGEQGAADALAPGAVVISCATMDPQDARACAALCADRGLLYLDAPMSGGAARAAAGQLTMLASGAPAAFAKAKPALEAMTAKLYCLGDEAGQGAAFKMINQMLAGVHIAAASEAMAFAAKQGLDLARVYEVITSAAGNSWMFENRMKHVVDGDYTPLSAVEIFVKDLGIVDDMARAARFPAPMTAAALQMFLAASGMGFGRDDDSSLARVYARLSGAKLPGE